MEDGIQLDFQRLTSWEGEITMKSLLHTVAQLGGLSGVRLRRELAGLGRVLGYGRPERGELSWKSLGLTGFSLQLQASGRRKTGRCGGA
jgi:hypothetical protein